MGPKKKKQVGKNEGEGETVGKPAEEPKKEVESKTVPTENKPVETKTVETKQAQKDAAKPADANKSDVPKIVKTDSTGSTQKKLNLAENQNLSEAEILERRKLRFNNVVGTQVSAEQADKVKKERLQKFGAEIPESKQDLEKRRQKFSNNAPLNLDEDQQTIQKRRQKFGLVQHTEQKQDPSVVEDRKKKFGGNDISLDDEISKSKQQKKNFHNQHHNKNHNKHQNRFNERNQNHQQNNSKGKHDNFGKRFKR